MKKISLLIILILICYCLPTISVAQAPSTFNCGYVMDSTTRQLVQLAAQQIGSGKSARRSSDTRTYFVPLRFYVTKAADTTDSKAQMQANVDYLNRYYKRINVQFFLAGYERLSIQELMARNLYQIGAPDAINVIMGWSTAGGTSYGNSSLNGKYAMTVLGWGASYQNTLLHEMGHTFGLDHTFGSNSGTGDSKQLADNSNCLESGDHICDTPPDPYGLPGFNYSWSASNVCTYNGKAKDEKGNPYKPFEQHNVMSYWGSRDIPLTDGQYEMMQTVFLNFVQHNTNLNRLPPGVATLTTKLTFTESSDGTQITYDDSLKKSGTYLIEYAGTPAGPWKLLTRLTPTSPAVLSTISEGNLFRIRTIYNDATSVAQTFVAKAYCLPPTPVRKKSNEGIRSVSIPGAGIMRTSGSTADFAIINSDTIYNYGHFTAGISGTLTIGQPYAYTIASVSQPDRGYNRLLLLDLNQNGQFEDGEIVGRSSSGQLVVPIGARTGATRLRIAIADYTNSLTACWKSYYFDGEVEDYTVFIQPTTRNMITFGVLDKVSPTGHCAADTFTVQLDRTPQLIGQLVDIELSDTIATFRKPVKIGSGSLGQIGVRLPSQLPGGSYRMRAIVRDQPSVIDTSGIFQGGIAKFVLWQSASIDSGALFTPYFASYGGYQNYNASYPEFVVSMGTSVTTLTIGSLRLLPTTSPSTYTLLESRSTCGVNKTPSSVSAWLRSPTVYCVPSYSFSSDSLGQIGSIQVQTADSKTTIFEYSAVPQSINYQNVTLKQIRLQPGQLYNFSITDRGYKRSLPSTIKWLQNSSRRIEAWLDLNQNKQFSADERIAIQQMPYNNGNVQTFSFQYTPPASQTIGTYTLRIKSSPVAGESPNAPCTNYYSDTQDFLVDIGTPPRINLVASEASFNGVCSGTVAIGFTTSGSLATETMYTVQLSDRQGKFTKPTILASGTISPLTISLPDSVRSSDQFRLRVASADVVSGSVRVYRAGLLAKPVVLLPSRQCLYDTIAISIQNPVEGAQYSWLSSTTATTPQRNGIAIRWPLRSFNEAFVVAATNSCGTIRSDTIRLQPVGIPAGALYFGAQNSPATICLPTDRALTLSLQLNSSEAYKSFAGYPVKNTAKFRIYRDGKLIYNRSDDGVFGMSTLITADTAGLYSAELNYEGCIYPGKTIEVKASNPSARIVGDSLFCALASNRLEAEVSGGISSSYQYNWRRKGETMVLSTSKQLQTNQTGTYTLAVNDVFNCPAPVQEWSIRAKGPAVTPELRASKLSTSLPDSIVLTTSMISNGSYRWWQDNVLITAATSNTYAAHQSGSFAVELTVDDCSAKSKATRIEITKNVVGDVPPLVDVLVSPNPTSGRAVMRYYLARASVVQLQMSNVKGDYVQHLLGENQEAGWHSYTLDLNAVPAGIYIYKLGLGEKNYEGRLVRE